MNLSTPAEIPKPFWPRLAFWFIVAGALVLAWMNRFIQDDAFISFRYALNLVKGHGLVWNPGERIEGYTNFLWTLFMAIPHFMGTDVVQFATWLGMAFFLGTLLLTYRTALEISNSQATALLTLVLLSTNYTFSAYATGGLETQMQTCLLMGCVLLAMVGTRKKAGGGMLAGYSVLAGLSILTRLDSAVYLIPVTLMLFRSISGRGSRSEQISRIVLLCLPAVLLVLPWFLWKLSYYGDIVPNTFYAKFNTQTSMVRGAQYLFSFYAAYWLLPFVILLPFSLRFILERSPRHILPITVVILLWSGYVVFVGGDFMEFRILVPIIPLLMMFIAWLIVEFVRQMEIRYALVLLVITGSAYHAITFEMNGKIGYESISFLEKHLTPDGGNWIDMGRALAKEFNADSDVAIATGASGAIPYYSGLRAVDLYGLTDEHIAKYGVPWTSVPGHQKRAELTYLVSRDVNLVIGGMRRTPGNESRVHSYQEMRGWHAIIHSPRDIPPDSCLIEIPTSDGRTFFAWYVVKNPTIDKAIETKKWLVHPVARQ
ncbi:glycosyltransferase family 39 protein [Desulfomonile tiedjei]|uniref:PMT family glycosyltransferase, 4-amino-4-deoxy-L-arabinose transferase n=1 Tax=Desulfomonile tiedjei (strain ATCC 49306 / DSM 6799 / DCB-1) TaxID=706587 RepID=I4C5C6_DESTA|nr:glycosyltransferase family 39 protein [Desulfomonile tiedjei]AFM24767.1 PMT family glycosyltransferase, 4-amino-4-deoxy-L-arabinose transferase [Desulfomonile tiedjei DSM 6799]